MLAVDRLVALGVGLHRLEGGDGVDGVVGHRASGAGVLDLLAGLEGGQTVGEGVDDLVD
jgi:hypothetical protein